jgi:hypothetical protein
MKKPAYTTSFSVEKSPAEVWEAINDVRAWWSGKIEGKTDELGAEFTYRYKDLHRSTQKITELVPGKKIVWHVLDAHLSFVDNGSEWKGTDIVFALSTKGNKTVVRFTHVGLSADCECYEACSSGWSALIGGNLERLITTGKRQPDAFA